ncbi:PAS domain-containing protein [bacterium]|nr:PAS domain-containing protein [bacterium]MBU1433794.1 PAS domain-containing protein [bacterium]MBU1503869.1 PAS domain-containing protein [bacterium]
MSNKKKSSPSLKKTFPIVGIGASAGGLSAFEAFFSSMPELNPEMAFVLIQHLDPNHKSILNEIIQRYTRMKVFEVKDGMPVQAHCVYIIPPKYDIAISDDTLHLVTPIQEHGHRMPVDFFFRSLAQDKKEDAIGIIFSGTGHDGTEGIRAIKEQGGLVIAQDLSTAEFNGMPKSALDTGLVDYVLAPDEIPSYLLEELKKPSLLLGTSQESNSLKKIFGLLYAQTGHDFSMYKPNTIKRRIERRMAVNQINTLAQYLKYLQSTKSEVDELFKDLLIGVTNFFRDSEIFASLEKNVIPTLFANKKSDSAIRIWVAGCSTGEEAYSIAILLKEHMEKLDEQYNIQLFATDIDARAIAKARTGLYPVSIAEFISKERLKRFFTLTEDATMYRIHKNIRDMLIFSEHNIIKDPPFSRLDMISCRNLLIYMNASLQKKLIPLFHYSLYPEGILFLGSSETIGEFNDFFDVIDQRAKIYRCKDIPINPSITTFTRANHIEYMPSAAPIALQQNKKEITLSLRELTEQTLLQEFVPSAALINSHGDIFYLHGRTGKYLEMPAGETGVSNILVMAREGLQHDLSVALQKAIFTDELVSKTEILMRTNDHFNMVNLQIRPLHLSKEMHQHEPLYLVILEEVSAIHQKQLKEEKLLESTPIKDENIKDAASIKKLRQELHLKEKFLQTANEKVRTYNEELKSFNEEIQSMNEELQSTNEELETSKEELQSVNEELSTVNAELQEKVSDLSRSNNDMSNLLAGTGIGTVFVDHQLRILRFTPAITTIINLISVDIGRFIGHIVSNMLNYNNLVKDIKSVLDTLAPKEIEVQTKKGDWYLMRIQPYRTIENVIEGAVISFVDITEIVKMRQELDYAHDLTSLAAIVRDSYDAIIVQNSDAKIRTWNPAAVKLYGWSEKEALGMHVSQRIPPELLEKDLHILDKLKNAESLEPYTTKRLCKNGTLLDVSITYSALLNKEGKVYAVTSIERALQTNNENVHEK